MASSEEPDLRSALRGLAGTDPDASSCDARETIGRFGFSSTAGSVDEETARGAVPAGQSAASATGGYEILGEAGRGGMGIVYRARQGNLAREVAIKTLKPSRAGSDAAREAFLGEAMIAACLDHPNIAPVHDLVRTEDGRMAISMKLVGGISWLQILHPSTEESRARAAPMTLEKHLEILLTAANAVAYAHSKGVIHRDLKPSNVMVGSFGEVYVMDWGMAMRFGADAGPASGAGAKRRGAVKPCGTPGYMAPEQVQTRGDRLGPWTDVYLLGATLYEVIAGRPPHDGRTLYDVVKAAYDSEPPAFGEDVPEELQEICRRAMARKPRDRYPDVAAFQDALRQHLRHRQSHVLVRDAEARLAEAVAEPLPEEVRGRRRARGRDGGIYAAVSDALAGYRQALHLWSGNREARRGERAARLLYARRALAAGDFALAQAQLAGVDGTEATALAAEITAAAETRERSARAVTRLRAAAVVGAGIIIAGLAVGMVFINAERKRADAHALEAAENARVARDYAAKADENARAATENERKAREFAARVDAETKEKLAAMEAGQREAKRASDAVEKLQEKSAEAAHASQKAELSSERARAAEAEAMAEAAKGRAAESRHVEELSAASTLADVERLRRLEEEAEEILRGGGAPGSAGEAWLRDAAELASRYPGHLARLVELEKRALPREGAPAELNSLSELVAQYARTRELLQAATADDARAPLMEKAAQFEREIGSLAAKTRTSASFRFPSEEEKRRFETASELVAGIGRLVDGKEGAIARVQRRRSPEPKDPAKGGNAPARPAPAASKAWSDTLRKLAANPRYKGVRLAADKDLHPLGADPQSGLLEFLHLPSHEGPLPEREGDQGIEPTENLGMVFVLVPGGRSWIGSQGTAPGERHHVAEAPADEGPVHAVELKSFLISKYEMTQGQWLRLTGGNPSKYGPSSNFARKQHSLRHPVESVSFEDCAALEARGLGLPSEAQWEHAARAGTETPWWCGADVAGVRAIANVADAQFNRYFKKSRPWQDWDDGWMMHAAVGSFAANAFGLHDVAGNVAEWCADSFGKYEGKGAAGTGARDGSGAQRVVRGGSFEDMAPAVRSGARAAAAPGERRASIGFRPVHPM